MARTRTIGLVFLVWGLCAALPAIAQPGGGGRGGFGGGIAPDQILGLLAFDEKFKVTDQQLLKLRTELKGTYEKQQKMFEEMRSGGGDRDSMRENMMALRGEIMQKLTGVLSADQIETLKKHMQEQQSRRGNWGGGRGGPGGGGPGGPGGGNQD